MNQYEIEIDHLAVGLTKPPTKFGVPMIPFFINILMCFFGWMFYQAITGSKGITSIFVFGLIWLLIHAVMVLATLKDPFGLHIALINAKFFRANHTNSFWDNTDSYAP